MVEGVQTTCRAGSGAGAWSSADCAFLRNVARAMIDAGLWRRVEQRCSAAGPVALIFTADRAGVSVEILRSNNGRVAVIDRRLSTVSLHTDLKAALASFAIAPTAAWQAGRDERR